MLKKIILLLTIYFPLTSFADIEVFESAFQDIERFYIERPNIKKLTIYSLQTLAFKGGLTLNCRQNYCKLKRHIFTLPPNNNPYEWASFTEKVSQSIQQNSPTLRNLNKENIYEIFFDALTDQLDPFSRYNTRNEAKAYLNYAVNKKCAHLGMILKRLSNGSYLIQKIIKPSPASFAHLKPLSIIHEVEKNKTKQLKERSFYKALCGHEKTSIELLIETPSRERLRKKLAQKIILKPSLRYFYLKREKLLYLQLNRFSQTSFQELTTLFSQELKNKKIKGIIFDLRQNRGGILNEAVQIADAFLDKGLILKTKGRHEASNQAFYADDAMLITKETPMIILIDNLTASASEIMAEALKDHGRALIIGNRSYGKGVVQAVMMLPDQSELFLTWSKIISPSGDSFDQKGIIPLYCINKKRNKIFELCQTLQKQFKDPLDLSIYLLQKPKLFNDLLQRQISNNSYN